MLINLTPHAINLPDRVIEPSGKIIRVSSTIEEIGTIDGIKITRTEYGEPGVEVGNRWDGELPAPEEGVWYIVSAMTAQACPDRKDFLIPNQTRRDSNGNIIGCMSLATLDKDFVLE